MTAMAQITITQNRTVVHHHYSITYPLSGFFYTNVFSYFLYSSINYSFTHVTFFFCHLFIFPQLASPVVPNLLPLFLMTAKISCHTQITQVHTTLIFIYISLLTVFIVLSHGLSFTPSCSFLHTPQKAHCSMCHKHIAYTNMSKTSTVLDSSLLGHATGAMGMFPDLLKECQELFTH